MTRTLILTLLFCLLPYSVKGQLTTFPRRNFDGYVISPAPTPTIRVPIKTLSFCDFGGRWVMGTIQIDSVFLFDKVDTVWVK